jgi:hypothetical protein
MPMRTSFVTTGDGSCDELRVHRSAAVVAMLAHIPGVQVIDERTSTIGLAAALR